VRANTTPSSSSQINPSSQPSSETTEEIVLIDNIALEKRYR
jgi:hypothetical protein